MIRARAGAKGALPAYVLPALVAFGVIFGGLDSGVGQGILSLTAATLLAIQSWRDPMSPVFWRGVSPALVPFGLAALWGWAVSTGSFSNADWRTALTPDLVAHELVGFLGILCLLTVAAMTGYRRPVMADAEWWMRFGGLAVLVGLAIAAWGDDGIWSFWNSFRDGRYLGTLNNANVAAAAYGMIAIVALGRSLGARKSKARVESWIILALCIGVSAMTASRSGMIFTLIAALALILLRPSRRIGGIVGPATILLILVALALSTPLSYRLLARFDLLGPQFDFRIGMWTHFADIANASPWTGYGLGSFPTVNGRYAGTPYEAQQIWTVNSPHNLILSLVLAGGWPYAILILGGCAVIIWRIVLYWSKYRCPAEESAFVMASLLLAACSMVDIGLQVPALSAAATIMIGLAWGRAMAAKSSSDFK